MRLPHPTPLAIDTHVITNPKKEAKGTKWKQKRDRIKGHGSSDHGLFSESIVPLRIQLLVATT